MVSSPSSPTRTSYDLELLPPRMVSLPVPPRTTASLPPVATMKSLPLPTRTTSLVPLLTRMSSPRPAAATQGALWRFPLRTARHRKEARATKFRLHPVQHSGLWDRGCREERGVTAWGRRVSGCDTRCRCVFRHRIVETRSCTRWRDRVRSRTGPRTDGMKMANVAQHRLVDRDWQRLRSGPRYAAAWRESADAPPLWCPRRFP